MSRCGGRGWSRQRWLDSTNGDNTKTIVKTEDSAEDGWEIHDNCRPCTIIRRQVRIIDIDVSIGTQAPKLGQTIDRMNSVERTYEQRTHTLTGIPPHARTRTHARTHTHTHTHSRNDNSLDRLGQSRSTCDVGFRHSLETESESPVEIRPPQGAAMSVLPPPVWRVTYIYFRLS